jgi:tetratricopeptide (TPR) repeat protein
VNEEVAKHRRVAEQFPASAEAQYNLGNALFAAGDVDEAIRCYQRATVVRPDFTEALANLGAAFHRRGETELAISCFARVAQLKPDDPRGQAALASALKECGRLEEAVAYYREALALEPDFADAHFNLGCAQQARGQLDEAGRCYERTIELQPDHVPALVNLGNTRYSQRRAEEAIPAFRNAIAVAPHEVEAHNGLGVALMELGRVEEAIACFRHVVELRPGHAGAHCNLGNALKALGQVSEAIASYRQSLAASPGDVRVISNLGMALLDNAEFREAEECFERALQLAPDSALAHYARSLLWLLKGDFARGWIEHEWRWKCDEWLSRCRERPLQPAHGPLWDGAPVAGKTILLRCEQGLGDTLQFIRYAQLVKRLGATVVVECQKPLVKLLTGAPGIDRLLASGEASPQCNVQAPLLSLPGLFKTDVDTIPSEVPYLFSDEDLTRLWQKRLCAFEGFRVGVNWAGRAGPGLHTIRDIPVEHFTRLAAIDGVRLISLQKRTGSKVLGPKSKVEDAVGIAHRTMVDFGDDLDAEHGAFMDTAAIMMNLDLVITSDTSVAHLAGALGVPVWVALPLVPDWRWLLERNDSPWYPTMRLFRQKRRGDWAEVFKEIEAALKERARGDVK